jgi:hypothetical protein
MGRGQRGTLAALIVSAVAAGAWAVETISMLLPGEGVTSSLSAAGERRIVAFAGVAGSKLTLTAKASRASSAVPELSLFAPDGSAVALGETNPNGTGKATAKKIELTATGLYRIGVESASAFGGEFTLTTKCKVPLKKTWTATLTGDAPSDAFVPAAPGGVIEVTVAAKGKPPFDPTVELIAPSGASVKLAAGSKGRASIPVARLDELGDYVVRVTGGPGEYKAIAVVKPAKKRALTYHDVEARPEIFSATPTSTTNDVVVTFDLFGVGFASDQTAAIVSGSATKAAGSVTPLATGGAKAQIDLAGVAPGTYSLRIVTRDGNHSDAPEAVTLTNRTPGISSISPYEVFNKDPIPFDIRGGGFDATSTVKLTRVADGVSIPTTVQSRTSHHAILARATPPAYVTGPCDLEVRDPDGSTALRPAAVDLLGFRAAPAPLRIYASSDAWTSFYPRDSVWDTKRGRVMVAVQELRTVVFILFDPATLTVIDSLVINAAALGIHSSGRVVRPRLAYDPVTDTFAMGMTAGVGNSTNYSFVRVVSAADIDDTKLQTTLVSSVTEVTQTTPAANPDDGGYVVVWEEYTTASGSRIKTQVITPQLTTSAASASVVVSHPLGYLWEPVAAYQGNGRFVVAWRGAESDANYAVYATVVDAAGVQTFDAGPYVTATSTAWNDLFQPEVTRNPEDGSMLLAFTYLDVNVYRPGVQRLAPVSASPGPYSALDGNSILPQGYIDSIRWNPARNEFVATMTNVQNRVAIRRVNPDGTIRPAPVLESYEGIWGILYAGPSAGELGLVRAFDGTADDTHAVYTAIMHALAAPLR